MPNGIPVVFHNGSNYDYLFTIKELANEFEGQLECLGENMVSSLSNFVDNLTEGIHKIKCKDYDCYLEYESLKDKLIKY